MLIMMIVEKMKCNKIIGIYLRVIVECGKLEECDVNECF